MDDASMEHLAGLTSLKNLGLYSNKAITDVGIAHLSGLKNVEVLSLQFTSITDAGLPHIKDLPNLVMLDLRGTGVSQGALDQFEADRPGVRLWR